MRRPQRLLPEPLGVLAGIWAAAIGFSLAAVPMLIVWMASPGTGLTWVGALRLGGLVWIVAQGTPVAIAGVELTLLPWGLAIIVLLLLAYAGGWAARRSGPGSWSGVARLTAAGALTYAAIVGVIAHLAYQPTARASLVDAVLHSLVLAIIGLGWGSARAAGLLPDPRIPAPALAMLRAGVGAVLAILAVGAIAAAASLLAHFDDAITMTQSLGGGIGGGLALTLLGIAYAPVIAVWSAAYLLGAGVVLAPSVTMTPFIATSAPTDLPPFPLLAALPSEAPVFAWGLPMTGVLAGVLAGIHIARSCRREPRLTRLALAAGAAAVTGLLMAGVAWLASGGLGSDRLAHLGPTPATVGILAAVLVVLGAVPSAVVPGQSGLPRLRVARTKAARRGHAPADPGEAPTPVADPADTVEGEALAAPPAPDPSHP
ncbi:MAG: hypothetical protein GC156_05710 [Actinomycetales bacterium]|nr:hypothetical protein [Actinomycetales bacterium]